ncbi:ABC1 kinase family protein [Allofustis seminis]|uniref:ABC1 kinase family protein n=1 Tax=Allofustis seminis TaxID=166939 RepID=UPI00036B3744|nr:lipopolysaccharide core heptose(II) kinase RfaY [Allofustis seminis]
MGAPDRKRDRFAEIVKVLGSYGFGHLYRTRLLNKDEAKDAKRLRLAFEELGPTFIKFGQILSTRHDLLPKQYIDELSKLRDRVPQFPFAEAVRIFNEDFQISLDEVFEWVEEEPLASASIAQVHRATLKNGDKVILKVQRPDMGEYLLRDIQLFAEVLEMVPGLIQDVVIDARTAILEIEATTRRELDFRLEAAAIEKFRENNKYRAVVDAPKTYPEYTSARILVEEYIEGIHNMDVRQLKEKGYDLEDISRKLTYVYLLNVFEDGLFHADPHPGNLIIREGKIYFIDFGIYGEISTQNRQDLFDILRAVVLEDVDQMMTKILQMAIIRKKVDRLQLYEDIQNFFYMYANMNLDKIEISELFSEVLNISRKHGLGMPNDFVLLAKSLTVIEGVVTNLNGEISVMEIARMIVKNQLNWKEMLAVSSSLDQLTLKTAQIAQHAFELPHQLSKALQTVTEGRFKLHFEFSDYEKKERAVNQMVNRIVFAIIIASLILASAVIVVFTSGTNWSTISMFLFIGAGFMGLWLLWSIFKSGML